MLGLRWLIKKIHKKTGFTGEQLVDEVMKEIETTEFLTIEELIPGTYRAAFT